MSELRVWAPSAKTVELVRADERTPLTRDGEHWTGPRPAVGEDYALSLDGGPPRPDPRAPWLPAGVHGFARVPELPPLTAEAPAYGLDDAIIYELHIGCFTEAGTFDGAIPELKRLAELGITHVQLMPVGAFPGRWGWGYDGVGLFAPQEAYGGPAGLRRLVDACHREGLGVLLDVVYNHLGPEGNYLRDFGPYFSWRHRTPWGEGINLDEALSDEVRAFIVDNAAMWIRDYGFDGLRLDATHALLDTNATHILEAIGEAVASAGAERGISPILIAEQLTNDPWVVRSRGDGGPGMAAQWSDDFHHALHALLSGESRGPFGDFGEMHHLARCLTAGWYFDGRHSNHYRRSFGRPYDLALGGHRIVAYNQNHDQVGNRAVGERLISLCGPERARIAAAMTLLGPGTPMLFMGEEYGATTPFQFFADFADEGLRGDVERGRRRELKEQGFGEAVPSPHDEQTYLRSKLDRREADPETEALYRDLIALRRRTPALRDGDLTAVRVEHGPRWLAMQRGDVVFGFNLGPEPVTIPTDGVPLLGDPSPELGTDRFGVWRGALSSG